MAPPSCQREGGRCPTVSIWVLVLSSILVLQLQWSIFAGKSTYSNVEIGPPIILPNDVSSNPQTSTNGDYNSIFHHNGMVKLQSVLDIPLGQAVALPSVRVDDGDDKYKRQMYGGRGDKPHLGGFASGSIDKDGICPPLWKWMVEDIGINSLLDVGCGRGVSTSWFHLHGVRTECVEGSHDAITQTLLPSEILYEHDFSRGPWWPPQTVDVAWSVEVLEHVGRNFHQNLLPSFRKAALVFASHSSWGGWHHVEVHDTNWWILKFESYGFKYSSILSDQVKKLARDHKDDPMPNGEKYRAQHLWLHMMVFINPAVAALPHHHHLFAEPGCFGGLKEVDGKKIRTNRDCGTGGNEHAQMVETPLPDSFKPLKLDSSMDDEWERLVFGKTLAEYQANPTIAQIPVELLAKLWSLF